MLTDSWEGDSDPVTDELIDEDMACIGCQYNLRGLRPVGKCPECGTEIEKMIVFINQRALCLACFEPNEPKNAWCCKCGNPLTGSAATADYYRAKAVGPGKRSTIVEEEEVEPEPPSMVGLVTCYCFSFVAFAVLIKAAFDVWMRPELPRETPFLNDLGYAGAIFLILILSLIPVAAIFFPTRSYRVRKRRFQEEVVLFRIRQKAAEGKVERKLPREEEP